MKYNFKNLENKFNNYIDNKELSGALILVRKNNEILYKKAFGYSNINKKIDSNFNDVYKMMSMSKVVTAVGIMKLVENGRINLDDKLSKFIPEFKNMKVVDDNRYSFVGMTKLKLLFRFLTFNIKNVKTVDANSEITIRDLLSHSSGLEQGIIGLIQIKRNNFLRDSLETTVKEYSKYPLDFNPKTGTSYSPVAGFDLLVKVIEVASNKKAKEFFKEEVFDPLCMNNSTFIKNEVDENNLARLYKRKKNVLVDVTNTKDDIDSIIRMTPDYISGSGGLYSTIEDYSNLTSMLVNDGMFNNKQFLKKETVDLIHSEGQLNHLEPDPGMVWGLGVKIRQDRKKYNFNTIEGTYGWSGAFGTHFFITPKAKLEAILLTQRSDAGGSGFYISKYFEEEVFNIINENNEFID